MSGDFDVNSDWNECQGELRLNLQLIGTPRITTLYVSKILKIDREDRGRSR